MGEVVRRFLAVTLGLLVLLAPGCRPGDAPPPRLAVMIVIDGLSERQLLQYRHLYSPDGLGRLLEEGAHFTQARYGHSTTFTAACHATVSTGADPSRHGIVANDWVDRQDFTRVYSVQDARARPLDAGGGRGVSPRNLLAPTLGDALIAQSETSRVVGVAIKDRSAVLTAGHEAAAAYYLTPDSGRFITTTYYRDDYPGWWDSFYSDKPQDAWHGVSWNPVREASDYADAAPSGRDLHRPEGGMGKSFPHLLGSGSSGPDRAYYRELARSPFGHEYTLQFARAMLEGEKLGRQEGVTDLLALGFSSHDYVNHNYGPESIESQDDVLRLDAVFESLFELLDRQVGLEHVALAVTADHGFPDSPEHRLELGMEAGRIDAPAIVNGLRSHLGNLYGTPPEAVRWFAPGLFLNRTLLTDHGADPAEVEAEAARFVSEREGVLEVFTRNRLESDTAPVSELERAVRRGWHPERSGDLIVIQKEGWYLSGSPAANASMHGSPHSYDRHVPLIFWGQAFRAGHYDQPVEVIDLVPTLARALGIDPPDEAAGRVLEEAFGGP